MPLPTRLNRSYTETMVRVLIVEEHDLVRQALETRLGATTGLEIVGSTGHYRFAVQRALALHPDVILLEIKASEGLETLKALCKATPQSAVIVLTSYPDSREEDIAIQAGASSYLLKTLNTKALVQEIRAVAQSQHGV